MRLTPFIPVAAVTACALLLAGAPQAIADPAAPPAAPAPVYRKPAPLVRPTGEDMARYFPERAEREGVSGRAVIVCKVALTGELTDCRVESETPEGYGFGEAALKMAGIMRMKPASKDGVPIAGVEVRVPLNFILNEPPPPEGPITVTSISMAGDWRALGPEHIEEGNPVRAFIDAASISRKDGLARARMVLLSKKPVALPEAWPGGPAPALAIGAQFEIDCSRPRTRLIAVLVLRGAPLNRLESVTGLERTDWEDETPSRDEDGEDLGVSLRRAVCKGPPGVPGAPDLAQARDAWLASRK